MSTRGQPHRFRARAHRNAFTYWKCGAKTLTFLFWATLYMLVMKLTIFKSNVDTPIKDWSLVPDNYTKWLMQGPVLGDDEAERASEETGWMQTETDDKTRAELEERVERVRSVCRSRAIHDQLINSKEFFVDHLHSLVWCNIFKAASSSWLYKLNILGGYDRSFLARTHRSPLTLARKKFPRPSEEELRDALNTPGVVYLLVVREPFVRLLSAYRDKLENVTPPYYRKLARAIVAKHRPKATKLFGHIKSFGPTFYEFVAYLTEERNSPGFTYDEHWTPYYQFCSVCAVNFSVIAKVESLSRDNAHVIRELGLEHVLSPRVLARHTRLRTVMNKSRDGKNTSALLGQYFSQIDSTMFQGLLDIYGVDFEMFGYDPAVYKQYLRK